VELEITPEPDEAEREAIAAALAGRRDLPAAYRSAWRWGPPDEPDEPDRT
jgi:hypothetical protein